jgi:peptidoglycan/xylan/chitin deacetylase (PgdA/CDA1 family)
MRLVSPFLKHVLYPCLAKSGYLRYSAEGGPAVVTYHGILPTGYKGIDSALDGALVSAESFRQQLQLLQECYNVISPEQFLVWCESKQPLPARSVLLTCDDGLKNTLTDMLPVLQELRLSCLFFVTGASLSERASILWYEELYLLMLAAGSSFTLNLHDAGILIFIATPQQKRKGWWELVRKLSRFDRDKRKEILESIRKLLGIPADWLSKYFDDPIFAHRFLMLNAPELRQLSAAGMCIGAHTLSHPVLSQAPEELAWSEICESRGNLERALSREIWALAYPFGDAGSVTQREQEMAERVGFKCAFLNLGGGIGTANARFALPRVHVTANMSIAEFEAHVSGFHQSLRQHFSSDANESVTSLHA